MYAIQNMELRSNHARSGSLRENEGRLWALEVKNMFNYNQGIYHCFKIRKCKILGWVGQQFVNVYKGVGSVNVNRCQQGGWVKKAVNL